MININVDMEPLYQDIDVDIQSLYQDIDVDIAQSFIYAISPSAKVEQIDEKNYLITITDKDGTTTAVVPIVDQNSIQYYIQDYLDTHSIIEDAIQAHNVSDNAHADIRNSIQNTIQYIDNALTWGSFQNI